MLVPPQYANERESKIFTTLVESFETYETGAFSSDIVVNTIIAGLLNQIWSLVSSQQIIIFMPLFAMIPPANAQAVFTVLLSVAAFDMIPTDFIAEAMAEGDLDFESEDDG